MWFDSTSSVRAGTAERHDWVPAWALALPLAIGGLPVLLRLKRARRHAIRRGQMRCTACCYDLRATPERCPECGTVPAK